MLKLSPLWGGRWRTSPLKRSSGLTRIQLTEEGLIKRIYCWESPDAESIRRILNEAQFPLRGVYPMAEVDPQSSNLF